MIPWRPAMKAWLSLSPEALWIPGVDCTLVSGRCSSLPDLSTHGHDVTQGTAGNRPLWDASGVAPWLTFDKTRPDFLFNVTPIALGTNPYTVVLVRRYRSVVAGAAIAKILGNGTYGTDGIALVQQVVAGVAKDYMYQYVPDYALANAACDTTLRSHILRADGTNLKNRISGVDSADELLPAQTSPTGELIFGVRNSASVLWPADFDLLLGAIFLRSLSAGDMTVCGRLFQQQFGIA